MSSADRYETAFEALKQSHEAGRLAHAYIVVGPPPSTGRHFAESFMSFLLTHGGERDDSVNQRVLEHAHPDVHWIEPQSKSRKIVIAQLRELNQRIARTSYSGGWKAGILLGADRMTDGASNAFLKTLEEPPPRSIFFLLTAEPQNLLATIVSRCQRILLSDEAESLEEPWLSATMALLEESLPSDPIEALTGAARFKALMDDVKKDATEQEKSFIQEDEEVPQDKEVRDARIAARVRAVRSQVVRMIMLWRRDVLLTCHGIEQRHLHFPQQAALIRTQALALAPADALKQVVATEDMARQLDRNIPELNVCEADRLKMLGLSRAGGRRQK